MSDDLRVANGDGAAVLQVHFTPQAHFLIRRGGIPIDPVDAEILIGLRDRFYRQSVLLAANHVGRDVVFVSLVGSGNILGIGDRMAVHPDVRAIVDAAEIKPGVAAVEIGREPEFGAIPPGAKERAVFRHRKQREILADRIRSAGNVAEIFAVVRIGIGFVGDQRGDHGGRHIRRMPTFGFEADRGDLLRSSGKFTGRLQGPPGMERDFLAFLRSVGANGERRYDKSQQQRSQGCGAEQDAAGTGRQVWRIHDDSSWHSGDLAREAQARAGAPVDFIKLY